MQSIDLIRDNLRNSGDRVLARVEEMRDHCIVFPNPGGGCHTLWVLGHLAYIEGLVVSEFMMGKPNPVADWKDTFDENEPVEEASAYPPFDEVLTKCREMRKSTLTLIDTMTEDELDRESENVPKGWENTFGTFRHCFQYVADHWYMHRGQLAVARRAAGLERMWV